MGLLTFSRIFVNKEYLKKISIVGGVSVLKGKDDKQNPNAGINHKKGPFLLGVIFSALNPFFPIWWLTVGLKLISNSIHFYGFVIGILFLFSFHIWRDYAWLAVASFMI